MIIQITKMRNRILLSFIIGLVSVIMVSCSDENKGYEEYYHPMGNNPVQVVPWLKKVKKSFYGNEGRISLYEWNKKQYYTAQVFYETSPLPVSPFTIYEANDSEKIVFFHTDDALASDQDSLYIEFVQNAELVYLLWSNEKKYSVLNEH